MTEPTESEQAPDIAECVAVVREAMVGDGLSGADMDALAEVSAVIDPGPSILGEPDTPDPDRGRGPASPLPGDGPQDGGV